ncbi:hypothetical protein RIR_jg15131.t1 [Rhizophagus irregularis DAOM 181602=DAOM 197198]|nr:hypothetical protein RIR_jg15131.t1 [Rhizophagus irregularis DAOM 181602=DAOM 197198]
MKYRVQNAEDILKVRLLWAAPYSTFRRFVYFEISFFIFQRNERFKWGASKWQTSNGSSVRLGVSKRYSLDIGFRLPSTFIPDWDAKA